MKRFFFRKALTPKRTSWMMRRTRKASATAKKAWKGAPKLSQEAELVDEAEAELLQTETWTPLRIPVIKTRTQIKTTQMTMPARLRPKDNPFDVLFPLMSRRREKASGRIPAKSSGKEAESRRKPPWMEMTRLAIKKMRNKRSEVPLKRRISNGLLLFEGVFSGSLIDSVTVFPSISSYYTLSLNENIFRGKDFLIWWFLVFLCIALYSF